MLSSLRRHLEHCHKSPVLGLDSRRLLVGYALAHLKKVALELAPLPFQSSGRQYLVCHFLDPVDFGCRCLACGYLAKSRNQLQRHHKRYGRCRSLVVVHTPCLITRCGGSLVPADFGENHLCPLFLRYLSYIQCNHPGTIESIPDSPGATIPTVHQAVPTMQIGPPVVATAAHQAVPGVQMGPPLMAGVAHQAVPIVPIGPPVVAEACQVPVGQMGPPNPVHPLTIETGPPAVPQPCRPFGDRPVPSPFLNSFKNGLEFMPCLDEPHQQRFLQELQSITTPCSVQPEIMNFALDVYGSVAFDYFGGSYTALSKFLSHHVREPLLPSEHNLVNAASRFMDQCHEQLVSVDTSLLIDATKTGRYDTKASSYRVSNTLRGFFEDMEHRTNEDGERTFLATPEEKDILFDNVRSLVEAADSTNAGLPKKLSRKSTSTEAAYKSDFSRLMLFVSRTYRFWFDPSTCVSIAALLSVFASDTYHQADAQHRSLGAIATLSLLSLQISSDQDYQGMVLKTRTLPSLYAMAKAIHVSLRQNASYVYRIESPATIHGATSALLHTLRVAFVGCMVHAALSGDLDLQRALPSVRALSTSAAVMELSTLARVCKGYEQFLSEGIEPATHHVVDGDDVFRIRYSCDGSLFHSFTRRHFRNALVRACSEIESVFRGLLRECLEGKTLRTSLQDCGSRRDIVLDETHLEILLDYLFHTHALFYEPGTHVQCVDEATAKRRRSGRPKSVDLQASTVSARFCLRLPCGQYVFVYSSHLAPLVADLLYRDVEFRGRYDLADFRLRTLFGGLMQFGMRGTPRPWEMLAWKPGVNNESTIKELRADIAVRVLSDGVSTGLACTFRRNKHGGAGSKDTGFMAMPCGTGHLLGVFLSIFHSACGDFLHRISVINGGSSNSRSRIFLSHFFHTTSFISEQPTYNSWPSNDATIARCLEGLFCLPDHSISLPFFRQVMCRISTFQESAMEKARDKDRGLVTATRAMGFNHQARTRETSYNESVREGNQRVGVQRMELADQMDDFHHSWIGDQALDVPPFLVDTAVTSATVAWRCPRLLTDTEALGFLRICAHHDFEQRAPYQRMVVTDPLSMVRDSLVVGPCGSGKTNAIVASVLYAKMCYALASMTAPDPDHIMRWLVQTLMLAPGEESNLVAAKLLDDECVKSFISVCCRDPRPPPLNKFTIVIVPHRSAAHEIIAHINKMQLTVATAFDDDDIPASITRALDSGDYPSTPFDFDVLVMTAAKAASGRARECLEKCLKTSLLYTVVLDECHCFVSDISYMRCLAIIANLRRYGTPLTVLTGSLPRCLHSSLASVLQASFGVCMGGWIDKCTEDGSLHGGDVGVQGRLSEYIRNKGIWRPSITVPVHIAHCVVPLPPDVRHDRRVAKEVSSIIENIRSRAPELGLEASKVLVICGTTRLAREVHRALGEAKSVMLLGKSNQEKATLGESVDPNQERAFREQWIDGTIPLGVGTSVVAQCINQARCDVVISVDMLFNLITYLQASSRGGRSGQRALSLFLYRKPSLQRACTSTPDFTQQRLWGVDVESAEVRQALSAQSLLPLIQDGWSEPRCRRTGISEGIDGGSGGNEIDCIEVNSSVDCGWCCDYCSEAIANFCHGVCGCPPVCLTVSQSMDDSIDEGTGVDTGMDAFKVTQSQGDDNSFWGGVADEALLQLEMPPSHLPRVSPPSEHSTATTAPDDALPCGVSPLHLDRERLTHVEGHTAPVSIVPEFGPTGSTTSSTHNVCHLLVPGSNGFRRVLNPYSRTTPTSPDRLRSQHLGRNPPAAPSTTSFVAVSDENDIRDGRVVSVLSLTSPVVSPQSTCPLRAFLTVSDGRLLRVCAWHKVPHASPRLGDNPWAAHCCRRGFLALIGRSGLLCFRCGGTPEHCQPHPYRSSGRSNSRSDPRNCKFSRIEFNGKSCAHCGVHDDVGESHGTERCPGNRLWGLIIWAFRSETGWSQMKREWEQSGAKLSCSLDYPLRCPFAPFTKQLNSLWVCSLEFLMSNEAVNRFFWQCILRVLEREKMIPRTRYPQNGP